MDRPPLLFLDPGLVFQGYPVHVDLDRHRMDLCQHRGYAHASDAMIPYFGKSQLL